MYQSNNFFTQQQNQLPAHWQLLCAADLEEYFMIKNMFAIDNCKSKKGERRESFINSLKIIRSFVEKTNNNMNNNYNSINNSSANHINNVTNNNTNMNYNMNNFQGSDDWWKRGVVCGIVFLEKTIAINIQQLRLLLGKCKSSINGSLQQLGYTSLPPGREMYEEFLKKVPCFQKESSELKKWTLRESNVNSKGISNISPLTSKNVFICPLPQIKVPQRAQAQQAQVKIQQQTKQSQALVQPQIYNKNSNIIVLPQINTVPHVFHTQISTTPHMLHTQQPIQIQQNNNYNNNNNGSDEFVQDVATADSVQRIVNARFPCPAKFRYKYLNTISAMTPIQAA